MQILLHQPAAPIDRFVAYLWYLDSAGETHSKERTLPSGVADLIINLREDRIQYYDPEDLQHPHRFDGMVLSGASNQHYVIDAAGPSTMVGVHFHPGGAYPFFRDSALAMLNQTVSLSTLWPQQVQEWRERLLSAATPQHCLQVLEQLLLRQFRAEHTPHGAVALALQACSRPISRVRDMTAQIGLGERRFQTLFSDQVGLSPKQYLRVCRFQEALQRLYRGDWQQLTDLAHHCGYYDQAHFIHDFRQFSGLTPTDYVNLRGRHPNHVAVTDSD